MRIDGGHRPERAQHLLLAVDLRLLARQRLAGAAADRVERRHVARADHAELALEHRLGAGALAHLARERVRQPLVGRARHHAQRVAHAVLGHDREERRLAELHRERLAQRQVEDRVAGVVGEVREQHEVPLA